MSVSFGGVGSVIATFKTSGDIDTGSPVKMKSDGTVEACAAGERFCGAAIYVSDDGHAAVQLGGYIACGVTGSAAVGFKRLVADGSGGVKVDTGTTGGEYLVIETGTTGKVGFIM